MLGKKDEVDEKGEGGRGKPRIGIGELALRSRKGGMGRSKNRVNPISVMEYHHGVVSLGTISNACEIHEKNSKVVYLCTF